MTECILGGTSYDSARLCAPPIAMSLLSVRVFLDALVATSVSWHSVIRTNKILWRAQRGHAGQTHDEEEFLIEEASPHPVTRMKPHAKLPYEGRICPKGILDQYNFVPVPTFIPSGAPNK